MVGAAWIPVSVPDWNVSTHRNGALISALAGGVLALIGWCAGPFVGAPAGGLVGHSYLTPDFGPNVDNATSLFIVWQTGMALVLGLLLRRNNAVSSSESGGFSVANRDR